jgi:hypothetical protein
MGDLHILEPMSLMTTYPLVSSSYMLPVPSTTPSFFFGQIYGRNGGISHSHYIHMTVRERGVKSQAPFSRPQKRRKLFSPNFVRCGDAAIQEGAKLSQGATHKRGEQCL